MWRAKTQKKAYRKTVFVDGDLFNEIAAFYSNFFFSQQMMNDHIGHVIAKRVSFLVQAMHDIEDQLVKSHRAIVTAQDLKRFCVLPIFFFFN